MNTNLDAIFSIPAFQDNYIWLYSDEASRDVFIVDPGQAAPVSALLNKHNLTLKSILLTHHHHDHAGGIEELVSEWKDVTVYGSIKSPIKQITHRIKEGDEVAFHSLTLRVMEIPGHTLDHIAYYNKDILFPGDTLFSAGCGRIFEGTPSMMYQSLSRLMQLPPETAIFCGHEYTLANLHFAEHVEPDNQDIKEMIKLVLEIQLQNQPTLPSSIRIEKKVNPFFRCENAKVIQAAENYANQSLDTPLAVFTVLREWKNNYK